MERLEDVLLRDVSCWVGVDVGAPRKGFHVAFLRSDDSVDVVAIATLDQAEKAIRSQAPKVVAVDSPISTAPSGETARRCELMLNKRICGIRWTPDAEKVGDETNPYYEWIRNGLRLYERLAGLPVVECFPTASFTRWGGRRAGSTRSAWSQRVLESLPVQLPRRRLSQDDRDAIAAALTARAWARGEAERIGDIVVPLQADEPEHDLPGLIRIIQGHADTWALSSDAHVLAHVAAALAEPFRADGVTKVVAVEARGLVLGTAVALSLGAGLLPIRKAHGMLPGAKESVSTAADYRGRTNVLRLQRHAVAAADRVLFVDDWAETGSTALAARTLIERRGATWIGAAVVVDQLSESRKADLGRYESLVGSGELAWD